MIFLRPRRCRLQTLATKVSFLCSSSLVVAGDDLQEDLVDVALQVGVLSSVAGPLQAGGLPCAGPL